MRSLACTLLAVCAVVATAEVVLRATPSIVQTTASSAGPVTLSISNIPGASCVAAFSPPDSQQPIIVRRLTSGAGGDESLTFRLVNIRTAWVFRLLADCEPLLAAAAADEIPKFEKLAVLAESNVVRFANDALPTGAHLALGATPGSMLVMWQSSSADTPVVVLDGATRVTGTTTTYKITDFCEKPALDPANWHDPGFIHTVALTGLRAETTYSYTYGSVQGGMSTAKSFKFAGTGANRPTTVLAFGDMGVAPDQPPAQPVSSAMAAAVQRGGVDLALHIGDLSYARGFSVKWDWFAAEIEPIATVVPYMEYNFYAQPFNPSWYRYKNDSGGECGVPYSKRYTMPVPQYSSADANNLWYSFDIGNMHYVIASCEHSFLPGSEQYSWLANDMASVDRTKTPWLIFGAHRPFYQTLNSPGEDSLRARLQETLEPLLIKYKVDLGIWGHTHYYEHTCKMSNYRCDPNGVMHLIIGMAGNDYQPAFRPPPDWTVFRSRDFGYTSLSSANATALRVQFFGKNGATLVEDFWINK